MMENNWRKIEEELLKYYQDENDLSAKSIPFLRKLGFIGENNNITDIGSKYLDSKFIFDGNEHIDLLRSELLNLKEIRELCQSFYGQKTSRENVERFFKSKTNISDERSIGRTLLLLNNVDIITYDKRNKSVQFKESDQVEEEGQESYRTTRRTPYSNLMRFRKALRACAGNVFWIDRHFTKKGLEPLAEELTGEKYDSIRILCGPSHVGTHMRDDFERFKEEMQNRGIEAELRVLTEGERLRSIHDRWILSSDGVSWNVPPINSIYGNQEAELHQTEEEVDFDDWWRDSPNILSEWNEIQGHIDD